MFGPLTDDDKKRGPYVIVTRERRGWYAALIHRHTGQEIERAPDAHAQRRDAMSDARDWARDEHLQFITGA